jgi:uncharacterized RDD family membrane protein YckC
VDEQNVTQETTQQAPPVAPSETVATSGSVEYASLWARLGAYIVDAVAFGLVLGVLGIGNSSYGGGSFNISFGNLGSLLFVAYMVVMHVMFGATLGKMLLKIKVQDKDSGSNVVWGKAILRDFVGGFLSVLAIGIGYLWMAWDKEKQTWGDKFGNTIVVKK